MNRAFQDLILLVNRALATQPQQHLKESLIRQGLSELLRAEMMARDLNNPREPILRKLLQAIILFSEGGLFK